MFNGHRNHVREDFAHYCQRIQYVYSGGNALRRLASHIQIRRFQGFNGSFRGFVYALPADDSGRSVNFNLF